MKSIKQGTRTAFLMCLIIPIGLYAHGSNTHEAPKKEKKILTKKETNKEILTVYKEINSKYIANIKPIFEKKCFDCHATIGQLPWYYKVPGIKQLMDYDMKEAKKHLDMSKGFPFVSHETPLEDLQSLREVSDENTMPPLQYILGHWDSRLTENEKNTLGAWTQESIQKIKGVRYE
ncbi:heme-binding domain-containing protein [Sulfurimonas sp. SAG-AH-194-I05]|nr:heme-binding domain-containing protein [Sulfurimonas sp. SAG-AH-194-I05]MDF1875413.1 heme-binding domain-containing protein [Sulfurimonas sp. SAG-AH-194-I05]